MGQDPIIWKTAFTPVSLSTNWLTSLQSKNLRTYRKPRALIRLLFSTYAFIIQTHKFVFEYYEYERIVFSGPPKSCLSTSPCSWVCCMRCACFKPVREAELLLLFQLVIVPSCSSCSWRSLRNHRYARLPMQIIQIQTYYADSRRESGDTSAVSTAQYFTSERRAETIVMY